MNEGIVFTGVEFGSDNFSKIFALHFQILELGHVIFKSLGSKTFFIDIPMRPSGRMKQGCAHGSVIKEATTTRESWDTALRPTIIGSILASARVGATWTRVDVDWVTTTSCATPSGGDLLFMKSGAQGGGAPDSSQ